MRQERLHRRVGVDGRREGISLFRARNGWLRFFLDGVISIRRYGRYRFAQA
jgi:hypothetical protein